MEFDSVDEGVLFYRPGVCGALTQCLAVILPGTSDILIRDRCERNEFDRVDLDLAETDPVAPAFLDLQPLPQPDRERDVSGQDVVSQLTAELHTENARCWRVIAGPGLLMEAGRQEPPRRMSQETSPASGGPRAKAAGVRRSRG